MTWKIEWTKWNNHSALPSDLQKQMTNMTKYEREEAFYKQLEFGTGGMRGELGRGPNRMNIYTVRKVTAGLAGYIKENGVEAKKRGVVIAYDSCCKSAEFALEAAKMLGAHGIKSYIFQELRPTPELSFAVRYLRAYAGIMITASHNPPEYNGYKVYGAQLPPAAADAIIKHMNKVENELLLKVKDERELLSRNLVSYIGENLDQMYLDYVKGLQLNKPATNLHIVYTPLHGTGQTLVTQALQNAGFQHITIEYKICLIDRGESFMGS
ncbi:phospho-sugar mutase [Priestia megaterium]|uniref:phospho-sugar mutase n=1 Tax=Priestia megaterium TaxID=1404 RepID=UPI000D3E166C|nr:phospho-sugar mutase [Priestia megaterium]AWD66015.1 phospho-sugar mutase [Priestia megaterium]